MLSWDESVFRNEHVFEIDYVPETFKHRESQTESLTYALRPAVRGSRPLNVMVRGRRGPERPPRFRNCSTKSVPRPARSEPFALTVRSTPHGTRCSRGCSRVPSTTNRPRRGSRSAVRPDRRKLVEEDRVLVVALDDVNYLFTRTRPPTRCTRCCAPTRSTPARRSASSSSPPIPHST